jgi:hypothetical protein
MDKINAYLGEGTQQIEPIESLASATPAQLPGLRQNVGRFIASYTPRLAPALYTMPTPELQKLGRKVIGGVHYHKVFKQLPDYLEANWTHVSEQLGSKAAAYDVMVPTIEALGAAYGVTGQMDKDTKDDITKHTKIMKGISTGDFEGINLDELLREIATEEVTKIEALATDHGESITDREKNDYQKVITETLNENKTDGHFRAIMHKHYSTKVEDSIATHEDAIKTYLKSIATGIYEEAPTDIMRNYAKFASFGGIVGEITRRTTEMQKRMSAQHQ